jgi:hypothetical protein
MVIEYSIGKRREFVCSDHAPSKNATYNEQAVAGLGDRQPVLVLRCSFCQVDVICILGWLLDP